MILASDVAKAGLNYMGVSYDDLDCQAFVEKCLKDAGLSINLKGSNAWFRKMTWVGTPEECKRKFGLIPVGAFLFILEFDGNEPVKYRKDGIGNASHIGIYNGVGAGAIHSSASKGCVCESRFTGKSINGGWNRVGLWNQLMYDNRITAILCENKSQGRKGKKMEKVIISGGDMVNPVKMRSTASKPEKDRDGNVIARIPQNSEASLIEGGGTWNLILYGDMQGYVMSEFVHRASETPSAEGDSVTVSRARLEKLYDELGDMLGLRG